MAITAVDIKSTMWVTEDLVLPALSALVSDKSVKLGHSTTVAVVTGITKAAVFAAAMTDGAATIDLTDIDGPNGVAVDGSSLRIKWAKFSNPSTNGNAITVAIGASNGYDGFGAAFSVALAPGAEALIFTNDAGSDIGATKKTLDISGTGAQALSCVFAIG